MPDTPHLGTAVQVARALEGVQGFEVPSWPALAMGHRPPQNLDEFEIDAIRGGRGGNMKLLPEWNVTSVKGPFSLALLTGRALLRSQSGSGAGVALSTAPTHPLVRFDSQLFRTLLFRRLRLPLPLARRFCRCGRPIDAFGHHRAACARAGVLARRGFALECCCQCAVRPAPE